jgi:hypothetical protein
MSLVIKAVTAFLSLAVWKRWAISDKAPTAIAHRLYLKKTRAIPTHATILARCLYEYVRVALVLNLKYSEEISLKKSLDFTP